MWSSNVRRTTRPAAHYVQELTHLLVACQQEPFGAAVPSDHVLLATSYTCTALLKAVVPPATNTLPLKAPDAEP